MKHIIIVKAFRMARGQKGEEEKATDRKRKRKEGYSVGEQRFIERARERREDY